MLKKNKEKTLNTDAKLKKPSAVDVILYAILIFGVIIIVIPFLNVIAISFVSEKEYMQSGFLLWPKEWTLKNYKEILEDARVLTGYKTTLVYLAIGLPMNLLMDCCIAYALYRSDWPGKRFFFFFILITMLFSGGLIPTYLVMKQLGLTGSIWAVVLPMGCSTFHAILILNYFRTIPESLMEAADLDGANEWTILFQIVIPLAKPIIATVTLFVSVWIWNEYFSSLIYLRGNEWMSLQQVLRSIVLDSQTAFNESAATEEATKTFAEGIKMAAIVVTMVPVMCVYPFLQKYFTKGIMIGAIKA